jgi:hypothetical protein
MTNYKKEETAIAMKVFHLQPGDGTSYRFGFADLGPQLLEVENAYVLAPGIGNGSNFVLVNIFMESSPVSFFLRKDTLDEELEGLEYAFQYAQTKLNDKADTYTLLAVLLALTALVNYLPIEEAKRRMLMVPDMLVYEPDQKKEDDHDDDQFIQDGILDRDEYE